MQDVKMTEQPAVRENAVHETGRRISLYCCIDHSAIQPLKAASVLNKISCQLTINSSDGQPN